MEDSEAVTADFSNSENRGIQIAQNRGTLTINCPDPIRTDYTGSFAHSSLEPVVAFVPRPLLRSQIRTQLESGPRDSSTTLVVWGLGGAGKTQLVLDYVREYRSDYKTIFWLQADRAESLERDIVNLWGALSGITIISHDKVNVDSAVIGVKSWLAAQKEPCLMVFDGADTIDERELDGFVDVKHYIPDAATLHIVITTRSGTAREMTRLEGVYVGEMEQPQAAELFAKYARLELGDPEIDAEITKIVNELGCLALAVTLAATYVGRTPRLQNKITAYLPEYRQRREELLRRKPNHLVHGYSESVLTTWETSYIALQQRSQTAAAFLTLLSFLSFDDIFPQLFDNNATWKSKDLESWQVSLFQEQTMDSYKIEECFESLQDFSFLQSNKDQQSYKMHKMVHAWGHDRLTIYDRYRYSSAVLTLLTGAMSEYGDSPKTKLRLVPHVMANFVTMSRKGSIISTRMVETLSCRIVGFLMDSGRWLEGRTVSECALIASRDMWGEENLRTIKASLDLARVLSRLKKLEDAEKMQRTELEKLKRILGEEDRSTIGVMEELAITLSWQERLEEARIIQQEVLEKKRRIEGENHPATLAVMSDLATTLRQLGNLEEAAMMDREVRDKRVRTLGADYSHTIWAITDATKALEEEGNLEEAATRQLELLEKRRQTFGEEHPYTLDTMSSLATMLLKLDKFEEAGDMMKEVVLKRQQVLGEAHPDSMADLATFTMILMKVGMVDEAAEAQRGILLMRKRRSGEEHPETLSAMNNLGVILEAQGNLSEAVALWEMTLTKLKRICGDNHPRTKMVETNLATAAIASSRLADIESSA